MNADASIARSLKLDELLTLPEARERLNLGAWRFRSARKNGLHIRRFGNRSFLLGSDLADFLASQSQGGDRPAA